jgi:MFS family permease
VGRPAPRMARALLLGLVGDRKVRAFEAKETREDTLELAELLARRAGHLTPGHRPDLRPPPPPLPEAVRYLEEGHTRGKVVVTCWSEAILSSTYGASLLGAGALATLAGRLLHGQGSRRVYAVGAGIVGPSYLVPAAAPDPLTFALGAVVAGSVTGALGYYAAVHTVLAQLVPAPQRARAITTNTLWGAFASPIFLPLLAWAVLRLDWRTTLRATGVVVAVSFLLVAVTVPDSRGGEDAAPSLRTAVTAVPAQRTRPCSIANIAAAARVDTPILV